MLFEYINNMETRLMIETAYYAISQLNLWDWLRNIEIPDDEFDNLNDDNLIGIHNFINNLPNNPKHSGLTFLITMRHMYYIAKHGIYGHMEYLQNR
jgi:hypothetical protein